MSAEKVLVKQHGKLKAAFSSKVTWLVAAGVLATFLLSWIFVWTKTADCKLLCPASAGEVSYRIGIPQNRGSKVGHAACECRPAQPAEK